MCCSFRLSIGPFPSNLLYSQHRLCRGLVLLSCGPSSRLLSGGTYHLTIAVCSEHKHERTKVRILFFPVIFDYACVHLHIFISVVDILLSIRHNPENLLIISFIGTSLTDGGMTRTMAVSFVSQWKILCCG